MKKFYGKIFLFIVIFGLMLCALDYLSTLRKWDEILARWTGSEDYTNEAGREIVPLIEKVREEDGTTKLILGDSVCKQLFNGAEDDLQQYNKDISIVGSNGAITMAGQYILAREYLEKHPETTDIYLFVLPESLARTFDRTLGYQYVVLPLQKTGTLQYLDTNTIEQLKEVYGRFALNKYFVKAVWKSSVNEKIYLNVLKNGAKSNSLVCGMDIADQYILKIRDMCQKREVNFYLYPCPMDVGRLNDWDELNEQYENSQMYQYFPDFMKKVVFYPSEEFGDGVHFFDDFESRGNFNQKIVDIYSDTGLLESLRFE